eukprot:932599-Amphidinium_carterae.1
MTGTSTIGYVLDTTGKWRLASHAGSKLGGQLWSLCVQLASHLGISFPFAVRTACSQVSSPHMNGYDR